MSNHYSTAKRIFFLSTIMTCCLLLGCCRPAANPPPKLVVKKPTQMYIPCPPPIQNNDELAMADIPIKRRSAEKIVIMIDPGHGGDDYGTHSLGTPKYHEKYLNLTTAQMVKSYLQQSGFQVILTRTDDTFISLEDRAIFANKQNPRLFVSIHYNSAPSRDADGIEVFYYRLGDDKTRIAKSKELARAILNRTVQNTDANSRGVKHGNFAVIRETTMPAVLIEGGFLTNDDEMDKIKNPGYQKKVALGIAQGIQDYLAKDRLIADNP